jgi:hypothetical protein
MFRRWLAGPVILIRVSPKDSPILTAERVAESGNAAIACARARLPFQPEIVVDANGEMHLVFGSQQPTTTYLMHAHWRAAGWSGPYLLPSGRNTFSFALASSGVYHLVVSDQSIQSPETLLALLRLKESRVDRLW